MASDSDHAEQRLDESLERLGQALARSEPPAEPKVTHHGGGQPVRHRAAITSLSFGAMLVTIAIVTGHFWLLVPAGALVVAGGILLLTRLSASLLSSVPAGLGPHDPTRAHIGMGASVAQDAIVEPGAVVEMGATVGAGAHLKSGSVVRMGATVGANAVLEAGAIVSWGATVRQGAVLGEGVSVGAGATIHKDAEVPAGTYVMPGASYAAGSKAPARTIAKPTTAPAIDPRDARVDAACDRLEAELADSSEQVKAHLGASAETVKALRRTCHDLLRRERALREEASPEALGRLDEEKKVLDARLATETDEVIRRSLAGAVKAIAEQKQQRELLRRSADRLDAEQMRLSWTLEGLATQLVRLKTAGLEAGEAANTELARGVQQLHDEIDAIAKALDQVAEDDRRSLAEFAEAPATFESSESPGERERERE